MEDAVVDQILENRLVARNQWQTSCFEELALLFACYEEKSKSQTATIQAATGGSSSVSISSSSSSSDFNKASGKVAPAEANCDSGDFGGTDAENGQGKRNAGMLYPASRFELQREVLRLKNEAEELKVLLTETKSALQRESVARKRAEKSNAENAQSCKVLKSELKQARSQSQKTEEKYLEIVAKNHDLEARIIEEKVKMAETLNNMNAMFKTNSIAASATPPGTKKNAASSSSSSSSIEENFEIIPGGRVKELDKEGESTTKSWISNVGVSLPSEWQVGSDVTGIKLTSISYNSDGTVLASGGSDGVIQMWSTQNGTRMDSSVSVKLPVLSVDVKGSFVLATSERTCHVWKTRGSNSSLESCHKLTGHISTVVTGKLTPDCRYAVSGGRKIKIWDMASGNPTRTLDAFSKCLSLDINESGTLLVTGHADKSVRLWDLRTAKRVDVVESLHKAPITCVSFSKDGERILSSSMDNSLGLLYTSMMSDCEKQFLTSPEYRSNPWWSKSCFSPGLDRERSMFAASGSKDGTLFVWNVSSGDVVYSQKAHSKAITCTVWNPCGNQLATCDNQGGLVFWNPTKKL